MQEVEQLVYLTRGNPEDVYLLATAYLKQERLEDADMALGKIAEMIPGAQTHLLIGRTYRDSDRYERARRSLQTALELDPQMPRAHYYLGTVDLREGGRDLLDALEPLDAQVGTLLLANLDTEEREEFLRLLRKLVLRTAD